MDSLKEPSSFFFFLFPFFGRKISRSCNIAGAFVFVVFDGNTEIICQKKVWRRKRIFCSNASFHVMCENITPQRASQWYEVCLLLISLPCLCFVPEAVPLLLF